MTAFLVWWETQSNLDNLTTIFDLADLVLPPDQSSVPDLTWWQCSPLNQPFWG
jgi:hypothetical protein